MDEDATDWCRAARPAPVEGGDEVIVQRTRLGRVLVALAAAVGAVAGLCLVGIGVVSSPSLASEAAPDLLAVPELVDPIEDTLALDLAAAAPGEALQPEVARAVAARTVRDSAVVDDIARAAADAQRQWRRGDQPVLDLDARVLTPAALTALRDVDLDLARSIGEDLAVDPSPVVLPMTTDRAETVDDVRTLARVVLVAALLALAAGAALDPRRDRTIRTASSVLLIFGGIVVAAPLLAGLPDLSSMSWGTASLLAMTHAGLVPLAIGGVAALLLGAFLRAVAAQVAPLVEARIAARERAAVEPPPVSTGAQPARRSGRAVRQEAIDAFFAPAEVPEAAPGGGTASSDDDLTTTAPVAPTVSPLRGRGPTSDEFARVVDAVDSEPHGPAAPDAIEDSDVDDDAEAAADAAAERREALERIDGRRSRLRTHLPR